MQFVLFAILCSIATALPLQSEVPAVNTAGFGTGVQQFARSTLIERSNCPNKNLYNIVENALVYYNGTDNALGISQRVVNNVLNQYSGAWEVTVSQLQNYGGVTRTHWAYWGSSSVLSAFSTMQWGELMPERRR